MAYGEAEEAQVGEQLSSPSPVAPLTRTGVAKILGCSVTQVRTLESQGVLTPQINSANNNERTFDPAQVHQLASTRRAQSTVMLPPKLTQTVAEPVRRVQPEHDGSIASIVFAELAVGTDIVEIVARHQLSPDAVERLYKKWIAMRTLTQDTHTDDIELRVAELERLVFGLNNCVEGLRSGLRTTSEELRAIRDMCPRVAQLESIVVALTKALGGVTRVLDQISHHSSDD